MSASAHDIKAETAEDTTTVDVGGHPIRVRVTGPETGEPVLLIHGIARSLEDWVDSQDLLAETYRVINMDLPGFGLTRKLPEAPGLATFAKAAVGVLDALGETRPVHVMGNSLGGAISMKIAAVHPERVASLTLVASAGFGAKATISPKPMVYGALAGLPVVGKRFRPLATAAGEEINRSVFYDRSLATPERLKHAAKVGRQPDFKATFLGTARGMGTLGRGMSPVWRRELIAQMVARRIPTLVVWGDTDNILPSSQYQDAVAALPHAQTHYFAKTGHMPQVERATEFTALATEFITAATDS